MTVKIIKKSNEINKDVRDVRIILHNIRSTHNVGSIFRTSDAAGVSHIHLSGYTPTPLDRFNKKRKDIAKTALGAEDVVPWTYSKHISKTIEKLKTEGFVVIAIEQSEHSVDYKKIKIGKKIALIVGNEVKGMSPQLLQHADFIAEIPMRGDKESLNVSVAFGIAIFRMLSI